MHAIYRHNIHLKDRIYGYRLQSIKPPYLSENPEPHDQADYHKQAQTRTDCGLDTPVGVLTVVYTDGDEEKTMTLTLGALAEGGDSYYAMLDDDPIIYLIPSNEIGSLFSMTVDNLTAVEETEEETDAESGTETETDTQSDTTTD